MRLIKKVSVLVLDIAMIVGSIFTGKVDNSYAATSSIKKLNVGKEYKYDLDGDKDEDYIKVYISGDKLKLKVNNATKTLISNFNEEYYYSVKLYDFNKKDKSKEIVCYWSIDDTWATRILKFKDDKCKVNKLYNDAILKNYNPNNGMITFEEYDNGRYNAFSKAIGCFCCYGKVRLNGYNLYNQYTANTFGIVKNNKYKANKKLIVYTNTNSKIKKFTIKKDDKVYITALYKKGNDKYIKVKDTLGKTGYVKVGTSMLFKNKSCVWAR